MRLGEAQRICQSHSLTMTSGGHAETPTAGGPRAATPPTGPSHLGRCPHCRPPLPPTAGPSPFPKQLASPHLLASLWVPEHLCFSDRQMAKALVAVAAACVQVNLKQAAQPRAEWESSTSPNTESSHSREVSHQSPPHR